MLAFLFTDIEGSTQKWEKHREVMGSVLRRHDEILRRWVAECGGRVISHTGDGMLLVFGESREGGEPLRCALEVQKAFQHEDWERHSGGAIQELRVRMGMHTGPAERHGSEYRGPTLNTAARIMTLGWGGQILLSGEMAKSAAIPPGGALRDHGVHVLKGLTEPRSIRQLVHPDLKFVDFPPVRSSSSRPHNLPAPPTPFVGRGAELKEIEILLQGEGGRLLTLLGPGGIGKSRIAIQAALKAIQDFPDGAYFVPLTACESAGDMVTAITGGVGFSPYGQEEPKAQLMGYVREKELLLVLDNFEHLIGEADLVSELIRAAPKLKMLVTSRERLNLHGEQLYTVRGMTEGGEGAGCADAATLFLQSAARIQPGFSAGEGGEEDLARICRLVDGTPLALELAAGWVGAMSLKEIGDEIERGLSVLSTSMRDVPERHRSFEATCGSSWGMLAEGEREAVMGLSVFRGGFLREAAEAVAGTPIGVLTGLVHRSFLRRAPSGRYEMHELLRQYAAEKLGGSPEREAAVRDRCCEYYLGRLAAARPDLERCRETGQGESVLDDLEGELGNIRAAWRWAVETGRWEAAGEAADPLWFLCEARDLFREGESDFALAVDRIGPDAGPRERLLRGRAMGLEARCLLRAGRAAKAMELLQRCLAIVRDEIAREEAGRTYLWLAYAATGLEDPMEAERHSLEALESARLLGERKGEAEALIQLGEVNCSVGRFEEARRRLHEGLVVFRRLDHRSGIAHSLFWLGLIAGGRGSRREGREFLASCLPLARELSDPNLEVCCELAAEMPSWLLGERGHHESLLFFRSVGGIRRKMAWSLHWRGVGLETKGRHADARRSLEESLAVFRSARDMQGARSCLQWLGRVCEALGELAAAEAHLKEGLEIAREFAGRQRVAAFLVALTGLAAARNDRVGAFKAAEEALDVSDAAGNRREAAEGRLRLAEVWRRMDDTARATVLCGEALDLFEAIGDTAGVRRCNALLAGLRKGPARGKRARRDAPRAKSRRTKLQRAR